MQRNEPQLRGRTNEQIIVSMLTAEPCAPVDSIKADLKDPSLADILKEAIDRHKRECDAKLIKHSNATDDYLIQDGVLLRYTGESGDVVIPEGVIWIWAGAFSGRTDITSVIVPEGVQKIFSGAFDGCTGLRSVSLPASLGEVSGLIGCGLDSIDIAVANKSYRLEGNCLISRYRDELVLGCNTSTIPAGVTSIRSGAFWNCKGLKSVRIPGSVKVIEEGAFWGCSGLEYLAVAEARSFRSWGNCIMDDRGNLILGCRNSVIPDGVVAIQMAFVGCSGIKMIRIPRSVTYIDKLAFYGCTELECFDVSQDNPVYRGEGSYLIERKSDAIVTCGKVGPLPARIAQINEYAFVGHNDLSELIIPDGVVTIGARAFSQCSGIASVFIPKSVNRIEAGAFEGCSGITQIEFACKSALIRCSFSECTALSSVKIPKKLTGGIFQRNGYLKTLFGNRFKAIEFTFTDD